jgi:hypothetical protein
MADPNPDTRPDPGPAPRPDPPPAPPFHTRYVFTLKAGVTATPVGETPTGYRVDIEYQTPGVSIGTNPAAYVRDWVNHDRKTIVALLKDEGVVDLSQAADGPFLEAVAEWRKKNEPPKPALQDALGWYGLDALLLSGSDWAILRSDGVAEFNGRLILRSKDPDGGLISTTAGGPVDLLKVLGISIPDVPSSPSQGLQAVLNHLQSGAKSAAVLVAATFDASGQAQPWAPDRMKTEARAFWKYRALTRSQFVAVGTLTLGQNASSPITQVEYHFYRVVAP